MKPLRLAIVGCTGRMGRTLMRRAARDERFVVVAALTVADDPHLGQDAGCVAGIDPLGVPIDSVVRQPCDALIEFTTPVGCRSWAAWCAQHEVPLVSGTTGLSDAEHATLRLAAERVAVVWAPNMSTGVNLMSALVAQLAARLDESWDVEICETHHRGKVDAPSGTAQALLESVCQARGRSASQTATYGRHGACGPRPTGQIGVHALRMGAVIGEHEVHFTCEAESLTLRHRTFSRDAFADGALRAACWLQGRRPGLYTMKDVLFA